MLKSLTAKLLSFISMWKLLNQTIAPKRFYELTFRWHSSLGRCALICLVAGVVWGLVYAPADYQQGDAFRLIYVHVPCAVWSMAAYGLMGILAVLFLVWRIKVAGLLLVITAQTGAWLALLALVTGSLWGKPMWGAWWVWDARLTSELILLFLYLGILAISTAYQHSERADRMAAILTLVGLVDLPIIHYSVNWWSTLHQGATLLSFAKPKIAATMLYPLLLNLIGFGLYCLWVTLYKARSELMWREHQQAWVKALIRQ